MTTPISVTLEFSDDDWKRFEALPGVLPKGYGAGEENLARMVFSGGLKANEGRSSAQALPSSVAKTLTLMAFGSQDTEITTLEKAWGLSRAEVLRIVVVDGLASVEGAAARFKAGNKIAGPSKGDA